MIQAYLLFLQTPTSFRSLSSLRFYTETIFHSKLVSARKTVRSKDPVSSRANGQIKFSVFKTDSQIIQCFIMAILQSSDRPCTVIAPRISFFLRAGGSRHSRPLLNNFFCLCRNKMTIFIVFRFQVYRIDPRRNSQCATDCDKCDLFYPADCRS